MSEILGKYQLVAELARGGMGIVYLAVNQGPGRFSKLLVIKELKPELAEDASFLQMFLDEARLAARLNHPNIVQTYEIGTDGNRHFIVMDYLEGISLARVLKRKSEKFTLAMHLRVLSEALQGLAYAHELTDFDGTPLGIVHRDATPQNVFVTFDGQVKVVDFGIAKTRDSTVETRTGVLKGKPGYMAPEQISGDVDARSDVYSASVMLWEAVVGRRMWQGKGDVEVLANILRGQTPSLREVKPDADDRIAAICDKGLAKEREERYLTAHALAEDIDAYMVEKGLVASPREIGKIVSEMFAEERERTRATIEAHLQQLRSGVAQVSLPRIRSQAPETVTPSGNSNRAFGTTLPSANAPNSANQPTPAGIEFIDPSLVPAYAPDRPNKKNRTGMFLVAGGVLLGGLSAFAFVAAKKGGTPEVTQAIEAQTSPESGAPAAAAPIPPPVTATATGPTTHELQVKVTPPAATVSFDGITYANPAKTTCRHGTTVLMRANATGYSARERKIDCDKDEAIEMMLSPLAVYAPPARQAPAAAPAPTPSPAATAAPASAAAKNDCNPPFYFQGTKKVFKPGCL